MKFKKISVFLSMLIMVFILADLTAAETILFEDDFNSYTSGGDLSLFDISSDWYRGDSSPTWDVRVGTSYNGQAKYQNNDADIVHMAIANMGGTESDYIVSAQAWRDTDQYLRWCIGGREASNNYVRLRVILNTFAELSAIYARVEDSTGNVNGDYYVGAWDPNKPIDMKLSLNGAYITGIVTHDSNSATVNLTTTVTGAGDPSFGGIFKWGATNGYFDNFKVTDLTLTCGDPGTITLKGDINENCYVDFKDFVELALDWMKCTDPNDTSCEPY